MLRRGCRVLLARWAATPGPQFVQPESDWGSTSSSASKPQQEEKGGHVSPPVNQGYRQQQQFPGSHSSNYIRQLSNSSSSSKNWNTSSSSSFSANSNQGRRFGQQEKTNSEAEKTNYRHLRDHVQRSANSDVSISKATPASSTSGGGGYFENAPWRPVARPEVTSWTWTASAPAASTAVSQKEVASRASHTPVERSEETKPESKAPQSSSSAQASGGWNGSVPIEQPQSSWGSERVGSPSYTAAAPSSSSRSAAASSNWGSPAKSTGSSGFSGGSSTQQTNYSFQRHRQQFNSSIPSNRKIGGGNEGNWSAQGTRSDSSSSQHRRKYQNWFCAHCSFENFENRTECKNCGFEKSAADATQVAAATTPQASFRNTGSSRWNVAKHQEPSTHFNGGNSKSNHWAKNSGSAAGGASNSTPNSGNRLQGQWNQSSWGSQNTSAPGDTRVQRGRENRMDGKRNSNSWGSSTHQYQHQEKGDRKGDWGRSSPSSTISSKMSFKRSGWANLDSAKEYAW